jgi:ribosomal 50S subunit-associated protein YjgA (DUF615 family)
MEKLEYWYDRGRRDCDTAFKNPCSIGPQSFVQARRKLVRETKTKDEEQAALNGFRDRLREINTMSLDNFENFLNNR